MRRFCLAFAAAATAAALALPAHAGQLTATASQNPTGLNSQGTFGSSISAYWPDATAPIAWATTTRTSISVLADGAATQMPVHQAASGGTNTSYTLWDLGTNAALDGGLAAALSLSFHFQLVSETVVPAVSISSGSLNYDAALYSVGFETAGSGVTAVYGPTAPFPSEGYVITGDASLLGSTDIRFDLVHRGSVGGLWTMGLSVLASGAADSSGTLWLESITLRTGILPLGGLAVRLETGEMIAVSAVPEAPAWALMLAGAGWLALLARRRLTPSR